MATAEQAMPSENPDPNADVQAISPFSSPAADPTAFDPTLDTAPALIDHRRYWANRAGQTVAELAEEQGVEVEEIERSLRLVRIDNERYSAIAAGTAARKLLFNALPKINAAIDEALTATKMQGKKVVMIDKTTGEAVTMEETIERPDHDIRLRTMSEVRSFFSVVQPRDPAVQIVSNSQTNILNQGPQVGAGAGQAGLSSPEAVIRAIVQQRQHALGSGTGTGTATSTIPTTTPTTVEGELVMARDRNLPKEMATEIDDDDEIEDELDEDLDEDDDDEDDDSSEEDS